MCINNSEAYMSMHRSACLNRIRLGRKLYCYVYDWSLECIILHTRITVRTLYTWMQQVNGSLYPLRELFLL